MLANTMEIQKKKKKRKRGIFERERVARTETELDKNEYDRYGNAICLRTRRNSCSSTIFTDQLEPIFKLTCIFEYLNIWNI